MKWLFWALPLIVFQLVGRHRAGADHPGLDGRVAIFRIRLHLMRFLAGFGVAAEVADDDDFVDGCSTCG